MEKKPSQLGADVTKNSATNNYTHNQSVGEVSSQMAQFARKEGTNNSLKKDSNGDARLPEEIGSYLDRITPKLDKATQSIMAAELVSEFGKKGATTQTEFKFQLPSDDKTEPVTDIAKKEQPTQRKSLAVMFSETFLALDSHVQVIAILAATLISLVILQDQLYFSCFFILLVAGILLWVGENIEQANNKKKQGQAKTERIGGIPNIPAPIKSKVPSSSHITLPTARPVPIRSTLRLKAPNYYPMGRIPKLDKLLENDSLNKHEQELNPLSIEEIFDIEDLMEAVRKESINKQVQKISETDQTESN